MEYIKLLVSCKIRFNTKSMKRKKIRVFLHNEIRIIQFRAWKIKGRALLQDFSMQPAL